MYLYLYLHNDIFQICSLLQVFVGPWKRWMVGNSTKNICSRPVSKVIICFLHLYLGNCTKKITQDQFQRWSFAFCICIWEILQKNYSRPVSKVIICCFIILYIHIYVWILFDFVALTAALYVTIRQYWSKGPHPRQDQRYCTMCALCIV